MKTSGFLFILHVLAYLAYQSAWDNLGVWTNTYYQNYGAGIKIEIKFPPVLCNEITNFTVTIKNTILVWVS